VKNKQDQMKYKDLRNQRMLRHSMQLPMKTMEVLQNKEQQEQQELKKKVFLLHKWSILKARVIICIFILLL
jgi:hypothetical protein